MPSQNYRAFYQDGLDGTYPDHAKAKISGSGGSTFARLKLKGIDGMTPPGVEYAA